RAQTDGFLQDYAALGSALMTLFDMTDNRIWQNRSAQVAANMLDRFGRPDGGFSTTSDESGLLIPMVDDGDLEMPSGTSMAIEFLVRLHKASGDTRYLKAATEAVRRSSGQLEDRPEVWASAIASLNRYPLPSTRQNVTDSAAATNPPAGFRVPVSADHV